MDFFRTPPPPESPSSLADEVLSCAPTLRAQLILLSVSGLLWYFALPLIAQRVIRPHAEAAPWRDRWAGFWTSWFQKSLQLHGLPAEQYFDQACVFTAILLQHFVGGLLCVPSVVGAPLALAAPLARLGALCEAGWEFQDVSLHAASDGALPRGAALAAMPAVHTLALLILHSTFRAAGRHALGLCSAAADAVQLSWRRTDAAAAADVSVPPPLCALRRSAARRCRSCSNCSARRRRSSSPTAPPPPRAPTFGCRPPPPPSTTTTAAPLRGSAGQRRGGGKSNGSVRRTCAVAAGGLRGGHNDLE